MKSTKKKKKKPSPREKSPRQRWDEYDEQQREHDRNNEECRDFGQIPGWPFK